MFIEDKKKSNEAKQGPKPIQSLLAEIPAIKWAQAWKDCAGPALLKQTQFQGCVIEGNLRVLKICVPDPLWRQELEFQKENILKKYQSCLRSLNAETFMIPAKIVLSSHSSMPFKPRYPQTSWNKSGVK
jgi:hypothetical protein